MRTTTRKRQSKAAAVRHNNAKGAAQAKKLEKLAERVKEELRGVKEGLNSALDHAIAAGKLLLQIQKQIGRGQWGKWVREHCGVRQRQARRYMELARHEDEIEEAKRSRATASSICSALAYLAELREEEKAEAMDSTSSSEAGSGDSEGDTSEDAEGEDAGEGGAEEGGDAEEDEHEDAAPPMVSVSSRGERQRPARQTSRPSDRSSPDDEEDEDLDDDQLRCRRLHRIVGSDPIKEEDQLYRDAGQDHIDELVNAVLHQVWETARQIAGKREDVDDKQLLAMVLLHGLKKKFNPETAFTAKDREEEEEEDEE